MERRNIVVWLVILIAYFHNVETKGKKNVYKRPISPEKYGSIIGQGFSTNWFKTENPMEHYNKQNIIDVANAGFKNLRLRCIAEFYPYPYNTANFTTFLNKLEKVVDDCLKNNVAPIISWIHHKAEAEGTETDRENYVTWWTKVAKKLRRKDYRLGFNLFTELGVDKCGEKCNQSLRVDTQKYNNWTYQAVKAIRGTGGKNKKRIIILGAPKKTAKGLHLIDKKIYENDPYMMIEWHTFAGGISRRPESLRYWTGNGTAEQRDTVLEQIRLSGKIPLKSYWGAWMAENNEDESLIHNNQTEVENFARYFVSTLKAYKIPWSLNVLDRYYNTSASSWITDIQDVKGEKLNMTDVLNVIQETMK